MLPKKQEAKLEGAGGERAGVQVRPLPINKYIASYEFTAHEKYPGPERFCSVGSQGLWPLMNFRDRLCRLSPLETSQTKNSIGTSICDEYSGCKNKLRAWIHCEIAPGIN